MKYRVYQKFETLGDPAEMISNWETPESGTGGGFCSENLAWEESAKISDSPVEYGLEAGKLIAERAVVIEEVDV